MNDQIEDVLVFIKIAQKREKRKKKGGYFNLQVVTNSEAASLR
jgi:hypothetical protein